MLLSYSTTKALQLGLVNIKKSMITASMQYSHNSHFAGLVWGFFNSCCSFWGFSGFFGFAFVKKKCCSFFNQDKERCYWHRNKSQNTAQIAVFYEQSYCV